MRRKILITLTAFCLMVLCNLIFSNQSAKAYYSTENGVRWYYDIVSGEARNLRVYTYFSNDTLTVPSTVTYNSVTYPVTSVGASSSNSNGIFYNSSYASYKNYVKKIIIPEGVKQIGCIMYSATGLETVELPESVEDIGVYAFYNCSNLSTVNFPSNIKTIGNYAFYNSKIGNDLILPSGLQSIGVYSFAYVKITSAVLPDSLTTIGDNAFYNCYYLTTVNFPSSLTTIGNSAFRYSQLTGELVFQEGLQTIGNYAFASLNRLTGNLHIPNSVTSIGADAFEYCTGLNGELTTGTGLKDIQSYVFNGCKFTKVKLGPVNSIGYNAFGGYTGDIWIDNEEENVTLNSSGITGYNLFPYIHYKNDVHNVEIATLPGIKLINQTTGEEVVSGDYECGTNFKFKLEIENGYNYPELQVIIVDNNDNVNYKSYEGNAETEYDFEELFKDRRIYVQNLSSAADFSLRMFITEVNRNLVSKSRVPVFKMQNGEFKYLHTKNPLAVKPGDLVTYKIRVYNESTTPGDPGKVAVHIPDGLEFVANNKTNVNAGWVYNNGVAVTSKLQGSNISGNVGNGVAKYKDIEMVLKVTLDRNNDADASRAVFAEIYENSGDSDSTAGNMNVPDATNYRIDELYETDSNSYIRCGEDDEDFDTIYLRGKIKVDYNIVINKIDGDTKQVLDGAKFKLTDKDGNVISTVESDDEGIVDFGGLSTYGDGTDIYYIQEIQTPLGYYLTDNKKIRVKVEKTILDEDKGLYSLKVSCDTLDYSVDTTRYDFTPIKTPEQFRKIGSGELVEVDGVKYQYNIDTNYKLMNDIDFSAEGVNPNWTPIDHEMKCIIDGNGYKIKGLQITGNTMNMSEIGIFSVFSGIIENLELEDITISFGNVVEEPENISGKTGVGAFAGVMRDGYIINCKTSGYISTGENNVGGFIGHTLENGIVRIDGCTNNIEIHGRTSTSSWSASGNDNVGGIVGCCLGSISVNNSVNNGQITSCRYNTGGLVGYVKPSEYQDISINTAYDEDNKILNLLVENITTEADYTVHLQDIDIDTEEALLGGVYTVYDGGKNILDGMENMELDEIMKKIVERQLRAVGLDTYYIIEEQPVKGYEPINGIVKLDVERYWDDDSKEYKFRITASIISDIKYEIAEPHLRTERPVFDRGNIFTDVQIEKANMNTEKAEFIGCTNNGEVVGCYENVAGIVATSHGYTYIENCKNTGHLNGTPGKVGGMIAELYAFKEDCVIKDCLNTGNMESGSNSNGCTSAAGIAANVVADIKVTNCKNTAQIVAVRASAAAGILGDARGIMDIYNCENTGHIIASSSGGSDCTSHGAGILGKNISYFSGYWVSTSNRYDNIVSIKDCKNTGDIDSVCHTGGIVGFSDAGYMEILDCEVTDCYIHDTYAGDKGGMVGFFNVPVAKISNCFIDNVDINRASTVTNDTYGCAGGMVGNWTSHGPNGCNLSYLEISNCTATNSTIHTRGQSTGGILGYIDQGGGNLKLTDCYVVDSDVKNEYITGTYGSCGGIMGNTYGANDIVIQNSVVERTPVESMAYGYDVDAGGIMGCAANMKTTKILNCDVIDSSVTVKGNRSDGCTVAGGIGGYFYGDYLEVSDVTLDNTPVTTDTGTEAGIIGDCHTYKSKYSNCTFKNATIYGSSMNTTSSMVAGIVGYTNSGGVTFDNCLLENAQLINEGNEGGCSNTSGILGMGQGNYTFNNCDVKNVTMSTKGHYSHLSNLTGIVGYATEIDCKDCDVEECEFIGYRSANVAGIIGANSGSRFSLDNCTVTNCTMDNMSYDYEFGSNTSTGGLLGSVGRGSISNSKVENCVLKTRGRSCGGLLGTASGSEVICENVIVKDIDIIDTDEVTALTYRANAGAIAICNATLSIDNMTVENIDIISKTMTTAGAVAYASGLKLVNDLTVNNIDIESTIDVTNGNNNTTAGVFGDISDITCKIKDMDVSDINILANTGNVAGFLGTTSSNLNLEDINLDRVNVENTNILNSGSGHAGGLVSVAAGGLTVKDCSVKNCSVIESIPEGFSGVRYAGGIVGYSYDTVIDGTDVINTPVSNPTFGYTGGLVGMIHRQYFANTDEWIESTLDVTNSSYKNGAISGYATTGGIVGMANETTLDNVEVNKATITLNGSGYNVGGLVGMIPNDEKTLTVSNSKVINGTSVTGKQNVAGMLGLGKIDASDNTLSNLTVTMSETNPGALIGGIVAISQYDSSIDGVTANNITIEPNSCHAGGLAGVMNGNISNVTMDTVNVEMEDGFGEVGGVAAIVNNGTLNNITVNNATIKARSTGASNGEAGAVAGVVCGGLVNNATVTNSTISSNKEAGGIAGVIGGNLKNSTVDNVTVTVSNVGVDSETGKFYGGDCGGAVGSCPGTIENVTVTNSTITCSEKLAGGVVGAGSEGNDGTNGSDPVDPTILKDLVVDSNTVIYGADEMTDGTYIGAPDLTVTFSDPDLGGNMIMEENPEVVENEELTNEPEEVTKPEEEKDTKEVTEKKPSTETEEKENKEKVVEKENEIATEENTEKEEAETEDSKKEEEEILTDIEEPIVANETTEEDKETSNIEAGDKPEKEENEETNNEENNEEVLEESNSQESEEE